MAGLIILTVCSLSAAGIMAWKTWRLKRDVYNFVDKLENRLDNRVSVSKKGQGKINWGRGISDFTPSPTEQVEDTLWSRVYEKLERIDHIWEKREEEALHEKRMLKELISDISHQTRTPIANLKLYAEFLQEEPVSEQGREFLLNIEEQTGKLDFLLQSMVKMSRLETGIIRIQSQKSALTDTLEPAVEAVVPRASRKGIRLSVECDPGIWINHDRKWTEEAIFNILDNAVKYTGEGGSVHITVSVQEIFTKISVRDTGKGIAPERRAQIFTRFYREPEVHDQEGIGIGLYLARKIIELQKGYIEVHSEAGEGSDFQIYLPND